MLLLGTYVPVTGGYQKTKERNEYDKCLWVIEQRQRRLLCLIWNNRYESKCLYFWHQTWRKCYDAIARRRRPLTNDYDCIFRWSKNANEATGHRIIKAKATSTNSIRILLPKARQHLPSTIYMVRQTTNNEKKMLRSMYTWWQLERRKKTSYDDTDFITPPFIATLSDRRHTPTTTTKEGSGDCREQEGRIDRSISEQRGPTLSRARPTINKK